MKKLKKLLSIHKNSEFYEFIKSEIRELETTDKDTLTECIKDNFEEMGWDIDQEELHDAIAELLNVGAK